MRKGRGVSSSERNDVTEANQTIPAEDTVKNGDMSNGEETLERALAERDEYLDQLKRSRADYQNLSRRVEQDRLRARSLATSAILTQLLPAVDDLNRALASVPEEQKSTSWVQGVQLIEKKLAALLEREGVSPINPIGEQFDPAFHEAVASDATGSNTIVTDVYQVGYRQGDLVLRPAMVKVGDPLIPSA